MRNHDEQERFYGRVNEVIDEKSPIMGVFRPPSSAVLNLTSMMASGFMRLG